MKKKSMKFSSPVFILQLLIVAAMLGTGWYLFDQLPDQMPTHWNIEGQVDAYMPKGSAILLFPGITLAVTLLFPLLSMIDPRKEKYVLFRRPWLILQIVIVLFFAYMYFVSVYLALNPEILITPFILGGIGVLFIIIGNYLGKVRQNYFVGIKTPWTLNSEEVWNKTQRVGGWAFMFAGIVILINGFVKWQLVPVMIAVIAIAAIGPIVYSYILYRKLKKL
ncbi:SdpI family protein [Patescibacteria group bacterium]